MKFAQREFSLGPFKRGCHLVHREVLKEIEQPLKDFKVGLCHVFIQHTSASITINENADPDVRVDAETFLNRVVPEGKSAPWVHTDEGPDDMPAHLKSSMFGCQLTIPITNGRLNVGTWQGIWLCEHRDRASRRRLVVTLQGE
uniref:Secondary thiamine-phosphate synthase enzyme n=1 Tax=Tetraselmis sp. GSL018 TaxID=582737 RepID=A0A061QST5_9CHLO|mmetsp:Transcript_10601/g.25120  ORF Transcript_10601/g.25120 Transcript_10601/m.25120 type:complete len:143 (+) Transcript_10601:66-494(+)